ncbi:PqqD family protein [Candidatus Omnitrophota bacterium]
MQKKRALRKNKNMVTRVIDGETILLPIYKSSDDINCIYTLNKVASKVWRMIDGKSSEANIKKRVLKAFDTTPKEVNKEMRKLLQELKEIKAVI